MSVQVKTNEDQIPWDPKPEDQKVDSANFKTGLEQLQRDALRFLELVPDIKMGDVRIAANVAFPLAQESTERALTKDDFEAGNAKKLLMKIGVPDKFLAQEQRLSEKPTTEAEEAFQRIVCRYLGVHSKVQTKVPIDEGLLQLELAVKGTESGFAADFSSPEKPETETLRTAVTRDSLMKEIKRAVLIPKFGKKFSKDNPNIPIQNLKSDKKRFLQEKSTKDFPLFGAQVIRSVISAADNDVAHQGAQVIVDVLQKEKYVFYNEAGVPLDLRAMVEEHTQSCVDCSEVRDIKNRLPPSPGGKLVHIPEELEKEVLLFADKRHEGFAEAYRRVKSWADFPNFRTKVTF